MNKIVHVGIDFMYIVDAESNDKIIEFPNIELK